MGDTSEEPFTVRAATDADVPAIAAIYAPMVTDTFASFEEAVPDEAELTRRMLARPRMPWLVAVDTGAVMGVMGYAYASQHRQRPAYRWSADCSVYLSADYRGRGVGRLLYEDLIAEVADLGYVSLFAGIALPNEASAALHEAMGFERLGVFRNVGYKGGSWRDVGWWQRTIRDLPARPDEPREWNPLVPPTRYPGRASRHRKEWDGNAKCF